MAASSQFELPVEFVDEVLGPSVQVGVVGEDVGDLVTGLGVLEEARVFLGELEEDALDLLLVRAELLDGGLVEGLVTPDTELLLARILPVAPRTGDRSGRLGLLFGDVHPVSLRELSVAGLAEGRDVAGGDSTPTSPAHAVLDERLPDVLRGEVGGARLPHPRERGLRGEDDVGALPGLDKHLRLRVVGDVLAGLEVAPQGCGGIVSPRVDVEPAVEVRDARDQQRRSLPGLPLDRHLQAVLVVGDVADAEAPELPGAAAEVPRDGEGCLVAEVLCGVDHGQDVVLPVEHLRRVGRRVVVLRRRRRDDLDAVGFVVAGRDVVPEHPQGDAVVPVGLLAVDEISLVDPADEALGDRLVLERVREVQALVGELVAVVPDGLAGEDREVAEELVVPIVGVLAAEEVELVRELDEEFLVLVGDAVGGLDAIPEGLDLGLRVGHGSRGGVEGTLTSGAKPSSGLDTQVQTPKRPSPAVGFEPDSLSVEDSELTAYSAIAPASPVATEGVSA